MIEDWKLKIQKANENIVEEFKKDPTSDQTLNTTELYHMIKSEFWKHWELVCLRIVAVEVEIAEKLDEKELIVKLKQNEVEIFDEIRKSISNWYMHREIQLNIGDYSWVGLLLMFVICAAC